MKLADGADARGDAVQQMTDFRIAETLAAFLYRHRLHAHAADQQGQAVGNTMIGFRHRIGDGREGFKRGMGEDGVYESILLSSVSLRFLRSERKGNNLYF